MIGVVDTYQSQFGGARQSDYNNQSRQVYSRPDNSSHNHQEVHLVKQLEVVSEEETLEGLALEVAVSGLHAVVLEVIDNTK